MLSGFKLAFGIWFWSLKLGKPLTAVRATKAPLVWNGLVSFPTFETLPLSFKNEIFEGILSTFDATKPADTEG